MFPTGEGLRVSDVNWILIVIIKIEKSADLAVDLVIQIKALWSTEWTLQVHLRPNVLNMLTNLNIHSHTKGRSSGTSFRGGHASANAYILLAPWMAASDTE